MTIIRLLFNLMLKMSVIGEYKLYFLINYMLYGGDNI